MISKAMSKILYGILWLISFLPLWFLYILSDITFVFIYWLIRYRRKLVKKNLKNSFPEKSKKELKQIEWKFYRHLCDTFIESVKLWHMSEKEAKKRIIFTNKELVTTPLDNNTGVMVIGGHMGNWEWDTAFGLFFGNNVAFMPLYKTLHNSTFDKMMLQIRSHFGASPMHKKEMLRKVIKSKKDGKVPLIAFIADQRPKKSTSHVWTTFMNQPTAVFPGGEKMVEMFDLTTMYIHTRMPKRGYYEITFIPIKKEECNYDEFPITKRFTELLELNIKEQPEIWLWSHSRWRYKPEDITKG